MKKYILLVVAVICVSVFAYFRREPEKPAPQKILRIGVECDYAPNNWEEHRHSEFNIPLANHEGYYAEGYDIQIARLVASELNAMLEVRKIPWNDLIPALNRGEIDAIFSGMLDTTERREQAAFSDTYEISKTEYTIIVNDASLYAGSKKFTDFRGAKLIAQRGTNLDRAIDQVPGAVHVQPVETVQEMLDSVVSGKVDGAVINLDVGRSYEATHRNLKVIRFPEGEGFVLGFNGICAGVRKEDADLLKGINRALNGISRSRRQKIMDETVSRLWKSIS